MNTENKAVQNRVIDALKANGCDLTTTSNATDKRPVPAEAVRGAKIKQQPSQININQSQVSEFLSIGEALQLLK